MTTQHECCSDDPPTDLRALARACKRRRSSQVHGRFWLFRSLVLPDCFVGVRTPLGQDIAVGTGRASGNQAVSVNIAAVEQRPYDGERQQANQQHVVARRLPRRRNTEQQQRREKGCDGPHQAAREQ